ncbi:MAG: GNAT family N-acetyltransferase [Planctomycetota bacterium]
MHFRGQRVVLRDFARPDLAAYAHWLGPGHEWRRWDGPDFPEPAQAEVGRIVARLREQIEAGKWPAPRERLAIADPHTNELWGRVARNWIREDIHWAAVGIDLFDPRHWGSGRGTEALGLWTDYLFRAEPRFVRLDLRTWSGNARVMRVAAKLGYRQEARYREARLVGGRRFDSLGYGVLRREWEARYPEGFRLPPP